MDCCAAAQESLKRSRMLHISNNTVQTFPSSAAICQQTATPDMHIHVQLYGCKACCPLEQHAVPCLASSAAPHKRRKQKNACPFKFLFSESKCSAVPPCPPDKPQRHASLVHNRRCMPHLQVPPLLQFLPNSAQHPCQTLPKDAANGGSTEDKSQVRRAGRRRVRRRKRHQRYQVPPPDFPHKWPSKLCHGRLSPAALLV